MKLDEALTFGTDSIRLAESAVDRLVKIPTEFAGLSAVFLSRASQSMTSVGVLVQHGLNGDAMSVARTVVELAIDLAYIATDRDRLIPLFVNHDHIRRFKLAKAINKVHGGTADPGAMLALQQKHDAALANDPNTKLNWAGINLKDRAKEAGKSSPQALSYRVDIMYDLLYADCCNASHSGMGTLAYTLIGDPSSPEIQFGPQEPQAKPVELAAGSLFDMASTACEANGLTDLEPEFARLRAIINPPEMPTS